MSDQNAARPTTPGGIDPSLLKFLQHTHLEKLYGYLPGLIDAIPAILGTTPEAYKTVVAEFDERARAAAIDLLSHEDFARQVDALPFRTNEKVLAVGDSITDDLQSWAEILRHLIMERRPDDNITIINGGLSAHTTSMILRRWPAALASRPDWVICGLGGNDITRIGAEPNKTVVSLEESITNLREMQRIAAGHGVQQWVWMTPPPVLEERVRAFRPFSFGQSSWSNTDVTALVDAIHDLEGPVVDLVQAIGLPPAPELQGEDGVHVTLAGQQAIVTELVRVLTDLPPPTS